MENKVILWTAPGAEKRSSRLARYILHFTKQYGGILKSKRTVIHPCFLTITDQCLTHIMHTYIHIYIHKVK